MSKRFDLDRRLRAALLALSMLCLVDASASAFTITFESDDPLIHRPNGFQSADWPEVRFSDTSGSDLFVIDAEGAGIGTTGNALAILNDFDDSGLLIEMDFVASAISLDVGNDAASFSQPGDEAVLTAFLDGAMVGQAVVLALNRNTLIDQTISFDETLFDSVTLKYDVNRFVGLTEVVDNIDITPIPEPTGAAVFGIGSFVIGVALRRRSGAPAVLSGG